MTDAELVARYISTRSSEVFTEIVERHSRMVYLSCLRVLGEATMAEDAAQGVFLVLSKKAARVHNLAGWLHLTAANIARRIRDGRTNRVKHEREAWEMRSAIENSDQWQELRPELDLVLASLQSKQRDAVVLRYLEGKSEKEVARELGCPRSTAATRIASGLNRMRLTMARRGLVMPCAALAGLLSGLALEPSPPGLADTIAAACTGVTAASAAATATAKSAMAVAKLTQLKLVSLVLGTVVLVGGIATGVGLAMAHSDVLKDDPEIIASIRALPAASSLLLAEASVLGPETPPRSSRLRDAYRGGAGDRNSRLLYSPERRAALHCGANRDKGFIVNDVWEYSLGANTWRLVVPSDGGDHRELVLAQARIKEGRSVEQNRKTTQEWYRKHLELESGYLRTRGNGGPFLPDVVYDGVAYDSDLRRLFWVVGGAHYDYHHLQDFAMATGQDPKVLKSALTKGTSLWSFDPKRRQWSRHLGKQPRPLTSGIAGTLQYDSRRKRILWYYGTRETNRRNSEMWSYDPARDTWVDLKPNGGVVVCPQS
jgi:RNA polymerase sigma factor (sigma-70 family)